MQKNSHIIEAPVTVDKAYLLQLYVTGASPNSERAIINAKNICETYLKDNYTLEIIDVRQEPAFAQQAQLIALPMLIKRLPLPECRLIGDLSNIEKVLNELRLNR
jgi:circadian clock protein KaiB